jgi:uncharacterized protein YciI
MLFMVAGYLKAGAEAKLINFRNEFSEHLAQRPLVAGGALRDRDGHRKGYLGFVEADSIEDAERFLHQSPLYEEELYERVEVFVYEVEVGQVGQSS